MSSANKTERSKHKHEINKQCYRVCDNVLKVKPCCLTKIILKIFLFVLLRYTNNILTTRSLGMSVAICMKSSDSYRCFVLITACRRKTFAQATSEDSLPTDICIYFRCYTVHVVELLNYYTNYCTYIKFIKFTY